MRIAVTGSTGLVGSAVLSQLAASSHEPIRLVRPPAPPGPGSLVWDPAREEVAAGALDGIDGLVHLAGESVAAGRWTAARKERIRSSRIAGTGLLARTLAAARRPPAVWVSASAVGYYGNRGDEPLDETSAPGDDFLAGLCREWEAATEPARGRGVRVVNLRIGFVLSPRGGGLARMLAPFRLGLGGRLGSGRQWLSWITIDDLACAILHALGEPTLAGPVNAVAPNPVTNRDFTRTLGRVLGRPAVVPVPAFAARLAFGEMADALLLASQRVAPARLLASGYRFRHPELEPALRALLTGR